MTEVKSYRVTLRDGNHTLHQVLGHGRLRESDGVVEFACLRCHGSMSTVGARSEKIQNGVRFHAVRCKQCPNALTTVDVMTTDVVD